MGEYAWYDVNSGRQAHEVGTKKPNPWNLYDIHGNVKEWCQDWYGDNYYYYQTQPTQDPQGPTTGSDRVHRGGSFYLDAGYTRSATRGGASPGYRGTYFGARLVRQGP